MKRQKRRREGGPAGDVYGALLILLPRSFRRRHGAAMRATFQARLERTRGRGARAGLLLRETADLALIGVRLRLAGAAGTGADDVRQALRSLVRNPAHAIFAGATLALGIGATTAVVSAVDAALLRPLDYPSPERVVTVWRGQGEGSFVATATAEQASALESMDDVFASVEPFSARTRTLSARGDPARVATVAVRPGFFAFAGVVPSLGRVLTEEDLRGEPVAVLGEALWASRFGSDPGVLGETLTIDGRAHTVVGVVPTRAAPPGSFQGPPDVWLPFAADGTERGLTVLARLREGVTAKQAAERANATVAAGERWRVVLRTARDLVGRGTRDALLAVTVAVGLLLLIACVNVSNLLLARAEARLHESAVRSALGAGRARLIRQHLVESLVLSVTSGAAGVGLAVLLLEVLAAQRPRGLDVLAGASLNGGVLLFALVVSVATGVLFGLAPALRGTTSAARVALRGGRTAGSVGGRRLSSSLVAAEVALSFLLLTGTGLVLRTVAVLHGTDVGFDTAGLLAVEVPLPDWRYPEPAGANRLMDALLARASALPGVEAAAVAENAPPRAGIWFGVPHPEGGGPPPPDAATRVFFMNRVGPGYLTTLRLPLLAGRGFTRQEAEDPATPVLLMSEAGAREFFPRGDAAGRRFRLGEGEWHTVVGVVGDVKAAGLGEGSGYPQVYMPRRDDAPAPSLVLRSRGDPAQLAQAVRALVRAADPALPPPEISSVESRYADTIARERFTLGLLALFAATALLLAAVGLYGVVAQVVGRRTREIGIRMSLGARRGRVFGMVLRQGLATTALGIVAGAALAAAGARLLSAGLFGVEAADPLVWSGAAATLIVAALSATWLPARRAARLDPVEAMRIE